MKLYPIQKGRDGMYMAAGSVNGRRFIASGETITEARMLRSQQTQITIKRISDDLQTRHAQLTTQKILEVLCTDYTKAI